MTADDLDAVASACAFLSHLFLRKEAGATAVASLDAEQIAAWPLARDADNEVLQETLRRLKVRP